MLFPRRIRQSGRIDFFNTIDCSWPLIHLGHLTFLVRHSSIGYCIYVQ